MSNRLSSQSLSKSEHLRQLLGLFQALCLALKSPAITWGPGIEMILLKKLRASALVLFGEQ